MHHSLIKTEPIDDTAVPDLAACTGPHPLQGLSEFSNRWLIMRHGHSGANRDRVLIGSKQSDEARYGLTPLGRQQVYDTFNQILFPMIEQVPPNERGILILSGELHRQHETAEIIKHELLSRASLEVAYLVDERLNDRHYGGLEGAPVDAWNFIMQQDRKDTTEGWNGAESVNNMNRRLSGLLIEIEERFRERIVLVVSSADPIQVLGSLVSKVDFPHYSVLPQIENAEIRELIFCPKAPLRTIKPK